MILSGFLAAAFGHVLVRPLKQIAHNLDDLSSGEKPPLPVNRTDEIGTLARALDDMADNVFSSHQELRTLNTRLEDEVEERTREVHQNLRMVNTISQAQAAFIDGTGTQPAFEIMLTGLLEGSESEYGFIGEVLYQEDSEPYMKSLALTNIAWDEQSRKLYDKNIHQGMEFYNLHSLFGQVIVTGEPVISNDPVNDERACGVPEGHPPLKSFLGIPVYSNDKLIGIAGIANHEHGYDENSLHQLEPFITTCAHMIASIQTRKAADLKDLELQHARADLEHAIKSSTAVFYTARASGDFGATFISENIRNQLGYEPADFTNDPSFWAEHIHPDDKQQVFDELVRLFEHGKHLHSYRFLNSDGEYRWMQDELRLQYDEQGLPTEVVGFWTDVTERKQIEQALAESEEKFRSVINSSPMGIFIYQLQDERLIFSDYNPAANTILGVDCDQFIGKTIEQAFPNIAETDLPQKFRCAARDGTPWHQEDIFL